MTWPNYCGAGPIKVGGLGDSIMALTMDELAASNAGPPRSWTAAAYPGVRAASFTPFGWAPTLAATDPDHVVIIGGTNDCVVPDSDWNGLAALGAQGSLISQFPNSIIHFVGVYANPPEPPPGCDLQAHVTGWNKGLEYWANKRRHVRLVDWPMCVYYFTGRGVQMLLPDGIHPTEQGQTLLAYIINQSIAGAS